MTDEIRLHPGSAQRIEAEIAAIAHAIHSERASLDRSVTGLVGGTWTGAAADAFGSGWHEWYDAAGTVVGALHAMGRLISEARVELTTHDDPVGSAHRILQSRLGPS